jgi:hypothetical protein
MPCGRNPPACKVAERASLSVIRAWPAANRRIRNRQVARVLLQFAAASSPWVAARCASSWKGAQRRVKATVRVPGPYAHRPLVVHTLIRSLVLVAVEAETVGGKELERGGTADDAPRAW